MEQLNAPYSNGVCGFESSECLSPHSPASSPRRLYTSKFEYMKEIAKELGENQVFYALDLADILWKIQQWREKLPNIRIFYAVKANPEPVLLRFLAILGLSFDCATEGEIRMVLKAGASPKNIVYAHTIKTSQGLKYASSVGVELMTFDNEEELFKIQNHYPNAKLLLRLSPVNVCCLWDLSDKFGCSAEEAENLLLRAKELNLNVTGLSFHVGALCSDPKSFVNTIRSCKQIFDFSKRLGFKFTLLDIGGGFFGASGTEDIFHKISVGINDAIKTYFPDDDIDIAAEPGCYLVASAFTLVTTIFGKRKIQQSSVKGKQEADIRRYYYVNESIYASFFRGIDTYNIVLRPLLEEEEMKKKPMYRSRIFGQTCCSEDVIEKECSLPDMELGECLVWENMGAYSQAVCSTFCAVPLPVTYYIFEKHSRLNFEWIRNFSDAANFLKEFAVFIGNENLFDETCNNVTTKLLYNK